MSKTFLRTVRGIIPTATRQPLPVSANGNPIFSTAGTAGFKRDESWQPAKASVREPLANGKPPVIKQMPQFYHPVRR